MARTSGRELEQLTSQGLSTRETLGAVDRLLVTAVEQRRPLSLVYADVRLPRVAGRRELLARLAQRVAGIGRSAGALGWVENDHLVYAMDGVEWMFAELAASRIEVLAPAALARAGTVVTGVAQAEPGEPARALVGRAARQARWARRGFARAA